LLESRPEYITDTKVESLKRILGNIDLEIGIGLETADDEIRRTSIHKCFDLVEFERAVKVLSDNQTSLLVYLLIKPAYLSERKAINDAINSGIYTFDLAKKLKLNTRIEYGPVFVQRDTPLYQLYAHRKYRTPWLWSVVEVIKNTGNLGPISIAPIESELMPKNTNMIAAYCTNRNNWNKRCSCSSDIEAAIRKYNKSRSLDDFIHTLPNCGCKREWLRELNY
jgi:radical SAM enzyme (TIGR01210 family)